MREPLSREAKAPAKPDPAGSALLRVHGASHSLTRGDLCDVTLFSSKNVTAGHRTIWWVDLG